MTALPQGHNNEKGFIPVARIADMLLNLVTDFNKWHGFDLS